MLASAIAAGASQLYDLLQSQLQPSSSSSKTTNPAATSGTGTAGTNSSFGTDLNQLLLDLQSNSSSSTAASGTSTSSTSTSSTDPSTTVANDLQNVFNDLQQAGASQGHHHHHHHHDADANSSASATQSSSSSAPASGTSATSPFQSLASSLLAYASTQGLSTPQTASTSVTA